MPAPARDAPGARPVVTPLISTESPLKSICVVGDLAGPQNAFLVVNLALALARLGLRICVVDMDESGPCLNVLHGEDAATEHAAAGAASAVVKGPLNVQVVNWPLVRDARAASNDDKRRVLARLDTLGSEIDMVLVSTQPQHVFSLPPGLRETIREFLVMVSPDKHKMLQAYKMIKSIFMHEPLANIGLIVSNIEHMYEIENVFVKMSAAARKFLDKELYKYGFLFKLRQSTATAAPLATFYDADLTACISNIAQIVVLRLNLGESASASGASLRNVLTQTVMTE